MAAARRKIRSEDIHGLKYFTALQGQAAASPASATCSRDRRQPTGSARGAGGRPRGRCDSCIKPRSHDTSRRQRPNSWPGWARSFLLRARGVVATSDSSQTAGRSRLTSNRRFASGRRPGCRRPATRAVSRRARADEINPALSVDRKHLGTSTIGPHPARSVPAVAPRDPPRSAVACRSAIGRPILMSCPP